MRFDRMLTVAKIDLRRLFKSKDYWIPMGFLAAVFFIALPYLLLTIVTSTTSSDLVNKIGEVLQSLPGPVQDNVIGDTPAARAAYMLAVYLLAPVAIVVPLTISSAVGAHAIVGERERGTGEFLAHSPLTEREIFLGKMLASLVPGFLATAVGFAIYSVLVNVRVGPLVGGWFFPTPGWWVLIIWVVPPFIAMALSVILWVSSRVRSTAAAQQAATLVSLPVIFAAYGISSGLLINPVIAGFSVGVIAWFLAITGLISGSRSLHRERLLGFGGDG
ncbi:MAG: ABC transporter permease subunit [Acidimicrobiia bacterium]|nr:ABC transporter permease subunit [Acidimicrobiia bacterium]